MENPPFTLLKEVRVNTRDMASASLGIPAVELHGTTLILPFDTGSGDASLILDSILRIYKALGPKPS